jgi:hypothetical protein
MALPVSDAQVLALRAFLSHATAEMAPLVYQLGDAGITGYLGLADAALSLLACRRFPQYSNADVVRYVHQSDASGYRKATHTTSTLWLARTS